MPDAVVPVVARVRAKAAHVDQVRTILALSSRPLVASQAASVTTSSNSHLTWENLPRLKNGRAPRRNRPTFQLRIFWLPYNSWQAFLRQNLTSVATASYDRSR